MCVQKMLNHGLNHGLFSFELFGALYMYISGGVFKGKKYEKNSAADLMTLFFMPYSGTSPGG